MKFLFLLVFILFFSWARADRAELRVSEKSTVRVGDPVRLGNLIQGEIGNKELENKIYDLVVFDPLTSEGEHVFQSEELALTLRRKLSFQDLKRLSLKIPETFTLAAKRNYLYAGDIKREIAARASEICSECLIEFEDLNIPELKSREEILQTRLEVQSLKKAGSFLIPLAVSTSQGRHVYWVTGQVSFSKIAPVAKRLLRPGEPISQSDFEMKKVDVSFAKDGFVRSEELAGKVAARTLTVGQPIYSSDLKKELAAQRGQMVKILVGGETFEIVSSGTAEEAGSVGDMIKVKSTETLKMLSGVLVDKGTVRVQ